MSNTIATLTEQHTAAKEARKAASAEFGPQSEQAKEAKKAIDRIYQAIKRQQAKEAAQPTVNEVVAVEVVEHVAKRQSAKKATPVSEADFEQGIYARRKVRRTGNVVERIDGKRSPLGTEGGRWILRIVGSRKAPQRFATRKELNRAARNA